MLKILACMAVLLVGCVPDEVEPMPDAGVIEDPRCPSPDPKADFFGEACEVDPRADVTACHGDAGWCIAGTCRPQCEGSLECRACRTGTERHDAAGACYCTP